VNDALRLKRLETQVAEAVSALKAFAEENARLARANAKLKEDLEHAREQLTRHAGAAARQDKLRVRLQRLAQKLDKIA